MELWFTEEWLPGLRISVKIKSVVCMKKTKYQDLAVFDTEQFGRMLVLDNAIQTTERDEYIYHECLAHVPMFCHPNPEKVLIIGGGDGGTLREVLRHPQVRQATLVDIDGDVIQAAIDYLPQWSYGYKDPRARVVVDDGLKFVAESENEYDVIIVDSTDPVGPGEALFRPEFYRSVQKALKPGGVMAAQTESPIAQPDVVAEVYRRIASVFPVAKLYTAPVFSYPGGWWSFTCACTAGDPSVPLRKPGPEWPLRYYSPDIHLRAFTLNPDLLKQLSGA